MIATQAVDPDVGPEKSEWGPWSQNVANKTKGVTFANVKMQRNKKRELTNIQ